jgi:organic hydroperoxide reductase OsmC/OhrA
MIAYPIKFISKAFSSTGISKTWKVTSLNQEAICCVPPEFGGPGGGFSPEDFFAQALMNCFLATFKVYAEGSKIEYSDIEVTSELTVDKNESGQPVMSHIMLHILIQNGERPDRIEQLVLKTLRSGFILNSVKTKIEHTLKITNKTN